MTQFNLGYRIEAKDATRSTLASALSGVTRFARLASKPITIPLRVGRKGLSLLRDINLGLRPLVSAIDNVIDRGARLEVVSKSFQSLTGKNAVQARRLAKELVVAASGTIKLSKAMEIANRALGSGINISQLTTAIEFISKKAITTGVRAAQALEKVITGLARGSTLFLDDFGILVDGIDGVRRAFDKVKGAGAFDSFGPAAQKAEIIRQAIAEMSVQMGKIGVTGKETIFLFQGIKNAIGDSVEKLLSVVAGSKALREVLKGVRDTLDGITNFIEGGGSIFDVLFGKEGGKSGGLFGILKAGALDIGEALGRGILVGILDGVVGLEDIITKINPFSGVIDKFNKVKSAVVEKVGSLSGSTPAIDIASIVKQVRPSVLTTAGRSVTPLDPGGLLLEGAKAAGANLTSVVAKEAKLAVGTMVLARGATLASKAGKAGMARNAAQFTDFVSTTRGRFLAAGMKPPTPDPRIVLGTKALGFVGKKLVPAAIIADFAFTMFKFIKELKGLFGALKDVKEAQEEEKFAQSRLEQARRDKAGRGRSGNELIDKLKEQPRGLFDGVRDLRDSLRAGGKGSSRFLEEVTNFRKDFPTPKKPFQLIPAPPLVDRSNLKLSDKGFIDRVGEFNLLRREIRKIEGQTRRDARRIARRGVDELRRGGGAPDQKDFDRLEREEFDRLLTERTVRQRRRIGEIEGEIGSDFKRRGQEAGVVKQQQQVQFVEDIKQAVDRMETMIGVLVGTINNGISAIVGEERKIASAGGRRT